MQVNSSDSMYQYQNQMQMRKMDGSGNGMGRGGGGKGNGMGAIMQTLPSEDQAAIQEQLSSLSETDRAAAVDQIRQLDTSSMESDELTQSIMDILNPTTTTQETTSIFGSLYA